jgi:hypothetical protein
MYFNSFNHICKNCLEVYEIKRDSLLSFLNKIYLNEIKELFLTLIVFLFIFITLLIITILNESDESKHFRIFLLIILYILITISLLIMIIKLIEYAKKDIPKYIEFENKNNYLERKENSEIKKNNFFSNKLKIQTLKSFKSITGVNFLHDLNTKSIDLNHLKLDSNLFPKEKMKKMKNTLNLTENYNLYVLNRNIYEIYEDKIDNLARINLKENEINLHFNTISQLKSLEIELDFEKNKIKQNNEALFFQDISNGIKINDLNNINDLLKKNIFFPNSFNLNNDPSNSEEEKKDGNIYNPIEKENSKQFCKIDLRTTIVIQIILYFILNN